MKNRFILIFCLIMSFSSVIFCQDKSDSILIELNKFYKENRLLYSGKVQEIFLNKASKSIDIDNRLIPLNNLTTSYENSFHESFKKNIDKVWIKCLDGNNCIFLQETGEYIKGLSIYFKSKKACYNFINLLDKLRRSIL